MVTGDPALEYGVYQAGGQARWEVYASGGSGFSMSPVAWPVRDSGDAAGLNDLYKAVSGRHWASMDIDGDGYPDLVQTGDPACEYCVFDSGQAFWRVYAGTP